MGHGDELLVSEYIERLRLKGRSHRTQREYARRIRRLMIWLDKPLTEATSHDLMRWRTELACCGNSIIAYVNTVKAMYAWLERQGHVPTSPARDLPAPKRRIGLPRPIGEDDLDYAIEHAPMRVRPWLVLAAYAGLRAQEIAYLTREDILNTWRPPMIRVTELMGKGAKVRMVPLVPYAWSELQAYGLPRRGYLFLRLRGTGPNRPATISNVANAYLHDCGFQETLHQLRHFYATEMLETSGGNLRVVQDVLGHASPSTTSIYTAVRPVDAVRAALQIQPAERRRRRAAEQLPDDAA